MCRTFIGRLSVSCTPFLWHERNVHLGIYPFPTFGLGVLDGSPAPGMKYMTQPKVNLAIIQDQVCDISHSKEAYLRPCVKNSGIKTLPISLVLKLEGLDPGLAILYYKERACSFRSNIQKATLRGGVKRNRT